MTGRPMGMPQGPAGPELRIFTLVLTALLAAHAALAAEAPALNRQDPVDFHRDVLPALQVNCLPCHNKTTSKADLRMETPADMLRGGESGPAIVPGKSAESMVVQLAAHRAKPRMPPKENKVNAADLTPRELALLELWIDQGARAGGRAEEVIGWKPMAPGLGPILATAVTADGQFAAAGRGNRIELYHLPTAQRVARLSDPALVSGGSPDAAHQDWVNALALSPDGRTLVSGGFREFKFWERIPTSLASAASDTAAPAPGAPPWSSPDGSRVVRLATNGVVQLTDASGAVLADLTADPIRSAQAAAARAEVERARSLQERAKTRQEAAVKEVQTQQERLQRGREAAAAASRALAEKESALARARRDHLKAEVAGEVALRRAGGDTNAAPVAAARDALKTARAALDKAEAEQRPAALKASTSANEVALAREGLARATGERARAETRLREAAGDLARAESALDVRGKSDADASPAPVVQAAAFSPDTRWLATVDSSGWLVVRAATNGTFLDRWRLPEPLGDVAVGFPEAGRCVVRSAGTLHVLDFTPRWRWVATITGTNETCLGDRVNALAFSPDGRWLASGSGEPSRGGDLWVWDVATRQPVFGLPNLHSDAVLCAAFSPDGRWLATGGADRFARLVDVASGTPVRALEGHTGHVLGVGWRADGQLLATAGADLLVKYWDPLTGERRKQASGFGREVTGVIHVPGSDQWVASSGDAGLRVINENGERVRGLNGGDDFTQSLAITPDGQWLVAGGQDGVLRVWTPAQEQPKMVFDSRP
ncbi:MAG: hypothetical protein J0L84_03870 [Verrucomicrobia bacterium]|nr:hypothetical protein [Verrucomicrobiota bacterium]